MIWIYAAAAVFGIAFLLPMVLSGLDLGGADIDFDGGDVDLAGGDVDLAGGDVELSTGAESAGELAGPAEGVLGAIVSSVVSFRTVVFFAAFFGTAGLVFTAVGYGPITTGVTSSLIGAFAATANSVLFGLVRRSEVSSQISDRTLRGRAAVVVLPMGGGRPGRVRIDLGGQPQYLVARPVDDGFEQRFDVGASVVVVEIENGTAMVTSLAELDLEEEL